MDSTGNWYVIYVEQFLLPETHSGAVHENILANSFYGVFMFLCNCRRTVLGCLAKHASAGQGHRWREIQRYCAKIGPGQGSSRVETLGSWRSHAP